MIRGRENNSPVRCFAFAGDFPQSNIGIDQSTSLLQTVPFDYSDVLRSANTRAECGERKRRFICVNVLREGFRFRLFTAELFFSIFTPAAGEFLICFERAAPGKIPTKGSHTRG